MTRQRLVLFDIVLVTVIATTTLLCRADDTKKEGAEDKDAAVADLAAAFQLADLGKRTNSPEALLAAAKILSRLNGQFALVHVEGIKPISQKAAEKKGSSTGQPVKEEGKMVSLTAEIQKLKKLARQMTKDDKLAELIDKVPEGGRGSFRGPSWINDQFVRPGDSNDYSFNFRGGQHAQVIVRNYNNIFLRLEIWNDGGQQICNIAGRGTLEWDWSPGRSRGFNVVVTNEGRRPASYDIFKN
jgi:hypothetical protein